MTEYLAFQCRSRLCLWCKISVTHLSNGETRFQCRTRLCWWCKPLSYPARISSASFNAARGFVGGARPYQDWVPPKAPKFQCRSRLCWWCKSDIKDLTSEMMEVSMPLAALLVVQAGVTVCSIKSFPVSMPLAALLVVQVRQHRQPRYHHRVSMPLAALLVVQEQTLYTHIDSIDVSMPLAALLVVQASILSTIVKG